MVSSSTVQVLAQEVEGSDPVGAMFLPKLLKFKVIKVSKLLKNAAALLIQEPTVLDLQVLIYCTL